MRIAYIISFIITLILFITGAILCKMQEHTNLSFKIYCLGDKLTTIALYFLGVTFILCMIAQNI